MSFSVSSISMLDEDLFDSSSFFIDANGNEYSTMSLTMEDDIEEEEEVLGEEECRKYAFAEIASTFKKIKNMNNEVAMSLMKAKQSGKKTLYYEKAIVKLDKALKILRPVDDITMNYFETETCACHCCSLDGCIEYTEKLMKKKKKAQNISSITNNLMKELWHMKKKLHAKGKKKIKKNENKDEDHEVEEEEENFHRKPICIPEHSIVEGHNMGSTLFLIIAFNLTLAHHLKALEKAKQKQKHKHKKMKKLSSQNVSSLPSSSSSLILMKGTIQLYKFLLKSINKDDTTESIENNRSKERFVQIVQKNMDHLVKSTNAVTAIASKKGQPQSESVVVDNLSSLHDDHQYPKAALSHFRRPSSTDSLSSIALISLKENDNDNDNNTFSFTRIRNSVKTSFSFICQSQQQKTVRCANAA